MMEVKKIAVLEGFEYDEDLFIEEGVYDFVEDGVNGYPMILVNDEWFDLAAFEEVKCMYINR